MANKTLADIFGAGATQTETSITIPKANLDMTATADNRGEQVVAALVKKIKGALPKSDWSSNPDADIFVESGTPGTEFRTIGTEIQNLEDLTLVVHFTQPQVEPEITPDNY